jgi:dTDP-glucose pyrophosphorylase
LRYQTVVTAAAPTLDAFLASGFPSSRNLLPVDGSPLLKLAIERTASGPKSCNVVLNREEEASPFPSRPLAQDLDEVRKVVLAPSASQGALVSALLGLEDLDPHLPLLISPGDAYLAEHFEAHLDALGSNSDAFTLSFRSSNPRWSYIELASGDKIVEVAEKKVISDLATTGHFYFRRTADFLAAAEWVLVNNAKVSERFFVSTALNFLVSEGMFVTHREIDRNGYFSFSKPHDFISQAE